MRARAHDDMFGADAGRVGDQGGGGIVAVTGGLATSGDTVSEASGVFDLVVSPVVISVVLGTVNVPGSDRIVPPLPSWAVAVRTPIATRAPVPAIAASTFTRDAGIG